ncbi:MAG: SurA N-terminal domain-containing protein [Pseudomonadota bacterium]|nr:SurA N-terminal domain-containing protein [Pseudomonadota bacterium]
MQQFRNLLRGWLGKLLLVIFILPFAFFGIEGIFTANSSQDVAFTVNGVEIPKMEVNRAIENQRQSLKQQMGGNIDDSFLTDEMLRPRVIDGLIQKELIRQAAEREGLIVSSELVKSYVRSMPQFQDESGQFSNDRLESMLVQANYSKAMLYDAVQESMVLEQLQSGIGKTAFITPSELEYLVELNNQQRKIQYATLAAAPLAADISLTEAEIEAFYQEHKTQYRTPERVKVHYVSIGLDDFIDDTEVDESGLVQAYDDYVAYSKQQERRRASHILVEINDDRSQAKAKARIEEALNALRQGQPFAEVAAEYSDDVASAAAGGDLDFAGRGLYDPAFEKALFALQETGDLSGIVQTEFGYHIIQLTAVESPEIAAYEDKKSELEQSLRTELAQVKLDEAVDDISRMAFESGDLQLIAESYEQPVQTTGFFSRQGGQGPAANGDFVAAAFSQPVLEEGHNSEVVELADNRVAVVRLAQHQPAREQPLEEVADQVRQALTQQKARQLAAEQASAIVQQVEQGTDLDTLTEEYNLTLHPVTEIRRQATDVPRAVVSTAFEMPRPGEQGVSVRKIGLPSGDQQIVVLQEVVAGEYDLEQAQLLQAKASGAEQLGNQDFANFVASLRDQAEINIR